MRLAGPLLVPLLLASAPVTGTAPVPFAAPGAAGVEPPPAFVARDPRTRRSARRDDPLAEALAVVRTLERRADAAGLAGALGAPDERVRHAAAEALARLGPAAGPAAKALRAALDDASVRVAVRAAEALGAQGEAPAALVSARRRGLVAAEGFERFLAARGLLGLEPAHRLAPAVVDLVARRGQQIEKLQVTGRAAEHPTFEAWVQPADAVLGALLAEDPAAVAEAMAARFGESWLADRYFLERMVASGARPAAWPALLAEALAGPVALASLALTELAPLAAARQDVDRWLPALLRQCSRADPAVRETVARTLGAAGAAAGAGGACLRRFLTERSALLRRVAAEALGALGAARQDAPLADLRHLAARFGGALRRVAREDPEPAVRAAARDAFAGLAVPSQEIGALLAEVAAVDPDADLRADALAALLALGPAAGDRRGDLPALRRADAPPEALDRLLIASQQARPAPPRSVQAEAVASLRTSGYGLNAADLAAALRRLDDRAVAAFLAAGVGPDRRLPGWNAPLAVALFQFDGCAQDEAGTLAVFDRLLAAGAAVRAFDARGVDPLIAAVRRCSDDVVSHLVASGVDVQHRANDGRDAFEAGLSTLAPGLEPILAAGYRLSPGRAERLRAAHARNPRQLALIARAGGSDDDVD